MLFFLTKTTCATIIGTPAFNTLYNLPLPIKQHGVFAHNIEGYRI